MNENRQINIVVGVAAILIMTLFSTYLLLSSMTRSIEKAGEKDAMTLLSGNIARMSQMFENQLTYDWKRVDMADAALGHMQDKTKDEVAKFLQEAFGDTSSVLVLSEEGVYLNQTGNQGNLEAAEEILSLFQDGKRMFLRQAAQGNELTFCSEIRPVLIEGTEMKYLLVSVCLDSYMDIFNTPSLGENAQIRILDKNGETLLSVGAQSDEDACFFDYYKEVEFVNHSEWDDLSAFQTYVLSGKPDSVHVIHESGRNEIVSFAEIPESSWIIAVSVDYDKLMGTQDQRMLRIGKISSVSIMCIVIVSLLLIFWMEQQSQKQTRIQNKELERLNGQLRENNASLEEAKFVAERAYYVAKEANKTKSIFLANMSHDIRTPLNAVIGFTNLAVSNLDNTEKVKDYLSKILSAGNHLLALMNEIIDMSRLENGRIKLEEKEANLSEMMYDIQTMISDRIHAKHLELHMSMQDVTDENVICDRARLNQVLINLLSNAIEFTLPGGTVSCLVRQLPDKSAEMGTYEFVVRDIGIGMSQEFVNRIFEPFEREDPFRVREHSGTGLGMPISKNIIDMMGGTIEVHTEQGKGTEFVIRVALRLQSEHQTGRKIKESEDKHVSVTEEMKDTDCLEGGRLLLVEDNELNREIEIEVLSGYGFFIDVAENGKEALEKIASSGKDGYDLIFMDIQMPIMDGYEATRCIRALQDSRHASTPIYAMTANVFDEDREAATESGMNGFLTKPINVDEVIQVLKKQVGSREKV